MGYIVDKIENLGNIDLDNIYVGVVKSNASPRPSVDKKLFLLNGDCFDGLISNGSYPFYFNQEEADIYLEINKLNWELERTI